MRRKDKEIVKYLINAIDDVKLRLKVATQLKDTIQAQTLVGDLIALENCLVTHVKRMVGVR